MNDKEIRDRILEIFNRERQSPNAGYDEVHFMDFLSHPPHAKDQIKNSFKGARLYFRFMDALELEFGICFSTSDLDRCYSVETLAKKVQERINKSRGNRMILKQRMDQNDRYWIEIALAVMIVSMYCWLGIHWVSVLMSIGFGTIIGWTVSRKISSRRQLMKLAARLEQGK